MILYIFFISAMAWSITRCEPPVNTYLPPTAGVGDRPSSQFGSPGSQGNQGPNRPQAASNQPQDSYFPPGRTSLPNNLDTQYGPPGGQASQQIPGSRPQFGSQSQGQGRSPGNNSPSSQYGVPAQDNNPSGQTGNQSPFSGSNNRRPSAGSFNRPSSNRGSNFGPDEPGFGERPDSSYGPPPSGNYMSPNRRGQGQGAQTMNSPYSVPNQGQDVFGDKQSLQVPPSSSYGTPGFGSGPNGRGSGSQGAFGSDESDEPAKYEFNYEVNDAQTGTKFGHSEQRDGDTATGEYNVELPDGRKQVVEYEAGLQGYKPQIRYEGGRGGGGSDFDNNGISQSGNQGYQQGGPGSGFPGSENVAGYPQESERNGRPGKYQQVSQGGPEFNDQAFMGYPSTRASENRLSNFPDSGPNGIGNEPGYASGSNNGLENLNGRSGSNEGYPRGGPRGGNVGNLKNGHRDRNGGSSGSRDEGYPRGSPANRESYPQRTPGDIDDKGYPSGQGRRDEGYPRGGPGANGSNFGRNGSQRNGNYPQNNDANQGYPSGQQGRSVGGDEGYPSGAPNGPRGSGY